MSAARRQSGETAGKNGALLAGLAVKGPYERLKYDLRRVWECPKCHHKERTGGETINRLCPCQEKAPAGQQEWMKLVEDGPRRVQTELAATE